MESSAEPGMPLPKYCSVATTLEVPAWASTAAPWDLAFTCPFGPQASWLTWHSPLTRCVSYQPYLHVAEPVWQGPRWLGRAGDAAGTWVLARREPDGFYYRAQIKTAPELERQGALLVEFEAPLVTGPELPAQQQSVVLGEDVLQFSPSMERSLQPGDKVLAPWDPDRQRYGPATVLGLEARDPQRAWKEEITVHFWNGKTATVPLGGVRWVPPAVWKKAVEKLHRPLTREHPSALLRAPCCSLLGPGTGCVTYGLPLGPPFLCPPCHPHTCCQLLCQGCLSCPLAGPTWWPLTRASGVTAREHPEAELKPTAQLLPLEAPKEEEVAVPAPIAVSSSSSSEEDVEKDLEMGAPQRPMVDSTASTASTDPVPAEKTLRRPPGGPCQPEWRYWRRNGPEPQPGKPASTASCFSSEEKEKLYLQRSLWGAAGQPQALTHGEGHRWGRGGQTRPRFRKKMLRHSEGCEGQQTTERTNCSSGECQGAGPGSNHHEATADPARESCKQSAKSGSGCDTFERPEFRLNALRTQEATDSKCLRKSYRVAGKASSRRRWHAGHRG